LNEVDEELDECGGVMAREDGGAGPVFACWEWPEFGASGSVLASIGRRVVDSRCGFPGREEGGGVDGSKCGDEGEWVWRTREEAPALFERTRGTETPLGRTV
jgi:hypothetical protein